MANDRPLPKPVITLERVYGRTPRTVSLAFLVDGLWPRGLRRSEVAAATWLSDVAPSPQLRKWFAHRVDRWPEFQRRYRLELPRASGDPDVRPDGFASEPRNPPRYNDDFLAADLRVVARYESRYEPEPAVDPHVHDRARERAESRGLRLHALDPASFDATLRQMHALSLGAFAGNFYYGPLPLEEFVALYAPFRERAVPELVRLASDAQGRLAGYLFGFPDPLSAEHGRPTRTVCKTVAVATHARGAGLGALLLDDFRAASLAFGARGILHALMHMENPSMRMSARHHSVLFKRYALYGWTP